MLHRGGRSDTIGGMIPTILGLDHVVIAVRDLDAAAAQWAALGFHLSPRGTHSEHMGSGNYTMMFGEDYLELLGVLAEKPHNAPLRGFLAKREGLERTAFTTTDAGAGVAALQARGIPATGPVHFGRPVPMPDGSMAEARFSVMHWPVTEAPAGLRIFACQHHTRHTVWVPELQAQPNGVTRIIRVLVASNFPNKAAEHLARLTESVVRLEDGIRLVPTGPGRADIGFAPRETIAALGGFDPEALPEEGGAALILGTTIPRPPAMANGCGLIFQEITP